MIPVQRGFLSYENKKFLFHSKKKTKQIENDKNFPLKAIQTVSYRQVMTITSEGSLLVPIFITALERALIETIATITGKNKITGNVLIEEGRANLKTSFQYVGFISLFTYLKAWLEKRRAKNG